MSMSLQEGAKGLYQAMETRILAKSQRNNKKSNSQPGDIALLKTDQAKHCF